MKAFIFALLLVFGTASAARAQCDQTLSVGDDIAAAVSSAPDDSTICLNAGNYGGVELVSIQRTGFVTVQPVSGASVEFGFTQVNNSSFIRLQGMTINGMDLLNNASHHVELLGCTFVPDGGGLSINGLNDTPPATSNEIIVDGCDFTNVSIALFDGRLNVRGMNGVKIRNNIIAGSTNPGQKADGIMLIGGSINTEIGPGNRFDALNQENAEQGEHVDVIQLFGAGPGNRIFENYFTDSDLFVGAFDGSDSLTIENNVFDGTALGFDARLDLGSADDPVITHNTFRDVRLAVDSKATDPASTNALIENNIFHDSFVVLEGGNGCTNCTVDSNLFSDPADERGTNTLIGTPTYVGGASPSAYEGWELAAGSVGENAANDGLDMGVVFGAQQPPPQVTPGETQLEFDHDGLNTDNYWLCADVTCVGIPGTPFTMPAWEDGVFDFFIRAGGPGGETDGPTSTFEVVNPPPPAPAAPSAPRIVG